MFSKILTNHDDCRIIAHDLQLTGTFTASWSPHFIRPPSLRLGLGHGDGRRGAS